MTSSQNNDLLDAELIESIYASVKQCGYSSALGDRLVAWLTELAGGGTSLDVPVEVASHFRTLIDVIEERDD